MWRLSRFGADLGLYAFAAGFGVSVGGGSYGGTSVGGGVGRPAEKDSEAVVHFHGGVVTYVRQATE